MLPGTLKERREQKKGCIELRIKKLALVNYRIIHILLIMLLLYVPSKVTFFFFFPFFGE